MICTCTDKVVCPLCTARRVERIAQIEKATGIEIRDSASLKTAMTKTEALAIGEPGAVLRQTRKGKGWSIEAAALYLKTSRAYLMAMESGRRPLSPEAVDFVKKCGAPLLRTEGGVP